MLRVFHSYEYTQFLFKHVFFMHFLPYFWVKIGSKMVKMHRFYIKTCAYIKTINLKRKCDNDLLVHMTHDLDISLMVHMNDVDVKIQ